MEAYSIREIDLALRGDIDAAKLRKTNEEADQVAMENAAARKELVEVEDFSKRLEAKAAGAKQFILDAGLTPDVEDKILNGLADLFVAK